MIVFAFILFWIACGVLSYGLSFAYFQKEYPTIAEMCYDSDRERSFYMAFLGPLSLLSLFVCGMTKHGVKFR